MKTEGPRFRWLRPTAGRLLQSAGRLGWARGAVIAVPVALLTVWAADRLAPPDFDRYRSRAVSVMAGDGRLMRAFPAKGDYWRFHATPAMVDPLYLRILKAYEDKRFDGHWGVDPLAVTRAAWQAVTNRRIVSGASTLTMQAARVLEPGRRSLAAKVKQMARALQLESRMGKDEILSVYLTLAPFGGNLEGVRAASLAYFGKEPKRLTAAEAALLVAVPKSPERFRPDRHPDRARAQRDIVLARMVGAGVLTAQQAAEARQEPIPTARLAMPFHAPHLARRFRDGTKERVRTTIDLDIQKSVEALTANWQHRISSLASLAILVRRNKTGAVAAYVGSASFFSDRRSGQVDMVRAVRSPGSTLKPFIYALAFDDGIAHPATLINDAPTRFGDYAPKNFRDKFNGEVTLRQALRRSLNVPAVILLNEVGARRFAARITGAGVPFRLPTLDPNAGLAVALGGVGVTLENLVGLYGALADRGVMRPLRYLPDADPKTARPPGKVLFQPAAVWQVARILEGIPRPGVVTGTPVGRRAIAWKTGTSYGFRDAWALGFDRDYTVGVWVGRPDGTPSPGSYGRLTAGPLLYAVFDALPRHSTALTESPPAGVRRYDGVDLPANLKRIGPRADPSVPSNGPPPPAIVFPPDGAVVEVEPADDGIQLEAKGGTLPLRWIVDGRALDSRPRRRKTVWRPDGKGFSRITAIDAKGRSVSSAVRIR